MGEGSALGVYKQRMASRDNNTTVKDTQKLFITKSLLLAETEAWPWQLLLWSPEVPLGWERSAALSTGKTYWKEQKLQRQYPSNANLWNAEQATNTIVSSCSSPPWSSEQSFPFSSRYLMTGGENWKTFNQWILTVAVRINVQVAIECYVIENRLSLHGIYLSLVFYDSHVDFMWPNWLSLRTLYQAVISVA